MHQIHYFQDEARRIIKKLKIHYSPKYDNWLDIAEIEMNELSVWETGVI